MNTQDKILYNIDWDRDDQDYMDIPDKKTIALLNIIFKGDLPTTKQETIDRIANARKEVQP
jgi:hypothetical protein